MAADLVSLPRTTTGCVDCLVVVDHYSKWVAAVPIQDKKSSTIVHAFSHQILPFLPAIPTNLLTDNGPEFTSLQFSEFLDEVNITHKCTTPLCPSSNGAVEHVNRTIQNFLRSIVSDVQTWVHSLPRAVIVYNNTVHSELKMLPAKYLLTLAHSTSHDISSR